MVKLFVSLLVLMLAITSALAQPIARTSILLRRDLDQDFSRRGYFLDARSTEEDLEARGKIKEIMRKITNVFRKNNRYEEIPAVETPEEKEARERDQKRAQESDEHNRRLLEQHGGLGGGEGKEGKKGKKGKK